MNIIDFRSDTVTKPTEAMMRAIMDAPLGDDVYGDDPTVNRLESLAAEITRKERALFVPTGTMGNLIALMAHTKPGEEVILEKNSHIFLYEVAGASRVAGLQCHTVEGKDGVMDPEDVLRAIRKEDIHFPSTGLIAVENTHNMAGGMVQPIDNLKAIRSIGDERGIPLHMDGARLFNAAAALDLEPSEITGYFDSVMFCLSKGLSSPVGSILAGSDEFIAKARKLRKMLGGGMRQAGVIAACGIESLTSMPESLLINHRHAKELAQGLNKFNGLKVDTEKVHTNIINVVIEESSIPSGTLVETLKTKGVLANPRGENAIRLVTHHDLNTEQVSQGMRLIKESMEELMQSSKMKRNE